LFEMSSKIKHAINLKTTHVVSYMVEQRKMTQEAAFKEFVLSKTYDLLTDEDSKLYTESYEYVLDMYDSELRGDWINWLEV